MKKREGFLDRLTERAARTGEPLPGLSLVELAGDKRLLLENHRGVLEYGTEQIRVRVAFGQLCICGRGLRLAKMTREQLVICGRIDSVTLHRGRS